MKSKGTSWIIHYTSILLMKWIGTKRTNCLAQSQSNDRTKVWFPLREDRPLGYLLFHFKLRVDSPSFRQDCEIGLCSAASSSLFLILFHEFLVSRDTAYLLLSSSLSPPAFYYQKGNYPFLNLFLCLRIPRNILFTYLVWFCLEWWETVL